MDPPLSIRVKEAFLGKDSQRIVASLDDRVVVFAWTYEVTEAFAYNPKNQTFGLIPIVSLELYHSHPFKDTKLYKAISNSNNSTTRDDSIFIRWKRGDSIRVWNSVDKMNGFSQGFAFNITTGKIGRFTAQFSFDEIL